MKFQIISINDDRASYKDNIRAKVGLDEVHIPATNAYEVDLKAELDKRNLFVKYPGMFSAGEIGVWLSTFDCWQWAVDNDEELVVFEDDAIPSGTFSFQLAKLYYELPVDYDFFCLWVPPNQTIDYYYNVEYDAEGRPNVVGSNRGDHDSIYNIPQVTRVAKVYNGYGNVAQLYSPKGGRTFIDTARSSGIYTPVDCFLYQEAHAGRAVGYGPKPYWAKLVDYDWKAQTTVHKGDRVDLA